MKTINGILLACLILTGLSQTRCSDDSSDRPALYEFGVTKVECATDVFIGHPINVNVTLTSNDAAENVPIEFYLAKHTDVDDEEVNYSLAGSYIIPTIAGGENTYQIKVTVPPQLLSAGEYKLTARVDPGASISKERTECVSSGDTAADREKACISDDVLATVNVKLDYASTPDLIIEEISLTSDVITFDTKDTDPVFIMGTMSVKSVAVETLNVPVRFTLEKDGTEYSLLIWDSDIGGYAKEYWIGHLRANELKSIPFSLVIDPNDADTITDGTHAMTLKATIDPDNKKDEAYIEGLSGGDTNNTVTRAVTIVQETSEPLLSTNQASPSGNLADTGDYEPIRAEGSSGLDFSKTYSQMLGNSRFGARPFLNSWARLNEDGAAGHVDGGVEVSIFNGTFNFVYMEASAAAVPHMLSSSFVDIYLKFAWSVLYSFHMDGEYSWDKDWTIYKSKGYTATFWAGPFPLNVSAGAQGTMGFAVSFGVGDNLEATASEFANAGAYVSASVGIPGLLEGGVKGNLNIVSYENKAIITAGLQLSAGAKQIQGWLQEQIITTLSGPNGSLCLFAKYPYVRWCRWWRVYYPCGIRIGEIETPFASFSSWSKSLTLMDLTQSSPWMNTGL